MMKSIYFLLVVLFVSFLSLSSSYGAAQTPESVIRSFYSELELRDINDADIIEILQKIKSRIAISEKEEYSKIAQENINLLKEFTLERYAIYTGETYTRNIGNGVKIVQNNEGTKLYSGDVLMNTYSHIIEYPPFVYDESDFFYAYLTKNNLVKPGSQDEQKVFWESIEETQKIRMMREKYSSTLLEANIVFNSNLLEVIQNNYSGALTELYSIETETLLLEKAQIGEYKEGSTGIYFSPRNRVMLFSNNGELIELFKQDIYERGSSIKNFELLEGKKLSISYELLDENYNNLGEKNITIDVSQY